MEKQKIIEFSNSHIFKLTILSLRVIFVRKWRKLYREVRRGISNIIYKVARQPDPVTEALEVQDHHKIIYYFILKLPNQQIHILIRPMIRRRASIHREKCKECLPTEWSDLNIFIFRNVNWPLRITALLCLCWARRSIGTFLCQDKNEHIILLFKW